MEAKKITREKVLKERLSFDKDKNFYANNLICKNIEEFILSLFFQKKTYILDKEIVVGLYFPINGEPDLLSIVSKYKFCFTIPKIRGIKMDFVNYTIGSPLEKYGKAVVMQPISNDILPPDIIFVPALAYDLSGYRLGFGRGHYDKYFAKSKLEKDPIKIGVCFHDNLYENLPSEPHDIKMDYIITNKITIAL